MNKLTPETNGQTKIPRATSTSELTGLKSWELERGLTIRERLNPSGKISYRLEVPAKISGTRQLLQFSDWHEADREAQSILENKETFGRSGFQLTNRESTDALQALEILKPFGATLTTAAKYFAKHEKPNKGDVTLQTLVDTFMADKRTGIASKVGVLRSRSLSDLDSRLGMFAEVHGEQLVKSLRQETIKEWLFANSEISASTRRNNFRVLRNLFNYAVENGYVAENPVLKVRVPRPEEKTPQILTVAQCTAILEAAINHPEWELLPYVAFGMFCGIRSEELAKLDWKFINMKTGLVTIPSEIAKKRRIRNFTMPDSCKAWLVANGFENEGAIRPIGFAKRFRKLVKAAGMTEWPNNALRHTAASYHYEFHKNASLTCSMLGQRGDEVLFSHYRALVTPDDAAAFYNLFPAREANVLQMAV